MLKRILIGLLAGAVLTGVAIYVAFLGLGKGWFGHHESAGTIEGREVPAAVIQARRDLEIAARRARAVPSSKQILFGDLHVHTTFSFDAFFTSLPMLQGEGAHPPADACDFARYCSALDFWSINDHAEAITPQHWRETVDAIRQCDAVAGDPNNQDLVSFLGWEWTQVGLTPQTHYGHKNVVLKEIEEGKIPTRPIASRGFANNAVRGGSSNQLSWMAVGGRDQRYLDFATFLRERFAIEDCPEGVNTRELPATCHEATATPEDLFRKLDEWGLPSIVIPHGTTWGFYTPAGSSWDKQLNRKMHDPNRQTMVEIYSGHGNSEQFRNFHEVLLDSEGKASCPEPTKEYLPSCWRAGEIIRERCEKSGNDAAECDRRAVKARQDYVDAGLQGHLTVPGATLEDWLDAGQCRDCTLPSFNYRPRSSVQYMMALTNFDDPANPLRFRFGFMGSSDNHSARPGTGYKEFDRHGMTETAGAIDEVWQQRLAPPLVDAIAQSVAFDRENNMNVPAFTLVEVERQASFFMTGGLIAVHSEGRNRNSVWDAMQRREIYGTSGDRILLWFDLLNPPGAQIGQSLPMGSEVKMDRAPTFQVKAIGAFEQLPGCPDYARAALKPSRLERLCHGECYNPSERRKLITRIEVVRIRPQKIPGEPIEKLIDDPWRTFDCPLDAAGCTFTFTDEHFAEGGRDALYYARAIEQPSEAINAGNLRCTYNSEGECTSVDPCRGDYRTPPDDDCLGKVEERAWSSPIFVNYAPPAAP